MLRITYALFGLSEVLEGGRERRKTRAERSHHPAVNTHGLDMSSIDLYRRYSH